MEIALLVSKKRLILSESPRMLWSELLDAGVLELPLIGDTAFIAVEFSGLHPDPADRFIAATAVQHGAVLMTADKPLLRWRHPLKRQDAAK